MIVLGADTHKRSHTIAAVAAATGEVPGEKAVQVGVRGFASLLVNVNAAPWIARQASSTPRPGCRLLICWPPSSG